MRSRLHGSRTGPFVTLFVSLALVAVGVALPQLRSVANADPSSWDAPIVAAGDTEATVTWGVTEFDDELEELVGYTVAVSPAGACTVADEGTGTSATGSGLTNGTENTFTITATISVIEGEGNRTPTKSS